MLIFYAVGAAVYYLIMVMDENYKMFDIVTSFIKHSFLVLILLFLVTEPAISDNNIDLLEQGKSDFYSGKLDESLQTLEKIEKTGNSEAQYYIALIYLSEHWSGRNIEKGISYLRSASDQNNAEAMWKIGELYENGVGVSRDVLQALDWYSKSRQASALKSKIVFQKKAGDQIETISQYDLISEIIRKADNNEMESQFKLANIYYDGKLIEPDTKLAFKWYLKAAQNGHNYSMLMTGYFYCRGIGVSSSTIKANKWLSKSKRNANCKL